jgi:hypothetical protein
LSLGDKELAYYEKSRMMLLPLSPRGPAKPLTETKFQEINGEISPDGTWIAYQQTDSLGQAHVFVSRFPIPPGSEKWQVDAAGGIMPMWWRNERNELFLFYAGPQADDPALLAVRAVPAGPSFSHGNAERVFPFPVAAYQPGLPRVYDIARDGRCLITDTPHASITIVSNWFDVLRARMAGK